MLSVWTSNLKATTLMIGIYRTCQEVICVELIDNKRQTKTAIAMDEQ